MADADASQVSSPVADAASSSSSSTSTSAGSTVGPAKRGKGSRGKAKRKLTEKAALTRAISRPAAKRLFNEIGRPTTTKTEKEVSMRLSRNACDQLKVTMGMWIKVACHEAVRRAKHSGRTTVSQVDVFNTIMMRNPHTKIFPRADAPMSDSMMAPPTASAAAPASTASSSAAGNGSASVNAAA